MKKILILAIAALFAGLQLSAQITLPEPLAGYPLTKEYISQNLVYPKTDLEQGNSGKVVIGFHLDEKGNATQHTVITFLGVSLEF